MKQNTQFKHSLIYGGITGGIIFMFLLLIYVFGMMNNTRLSNFAVVFFIAGNMIAVKHYRDRICGGTITYGKAFGTSYLTVIVTGFVWALYGFLLFKVLNPGLVEVKIMESQEALLQLGMSEEFVEKNSNAQNTTAVTLAFSYWFASAFYGAILSLLVALIYKRNRNPLLSNKEDQQ